MSMWWDMVSAIEPELTDIVRQFLGPVSAQAFTRMVGERQYVATATLLQLTWEAAPDDPSIHMIPQWRTLCMLLDGTILPPEQWEKKE